MINKALNGIDINDVNTLITSSVLEGKTIEYKSQLPGGNDQDKKEFLADVSSFSNSSGGDLIFGIVENKGVPESINGVDVLDIDQEMRKLENLIRDGLDPRISYSTIIIPTTDSKSIIIFRMEKSWNGPHRVVFKGHDKFYARNSAGKYPIDTSELKIAFNQSLALVDEINHFAANRTVELSNNNTHIPFKDGPKAVLHLIPFESFTGINIDTKILEDQNNKMNPLRSSGWSGQINLEGFMTYSGRENGTTHSYIQLYRSGIFEVVDCFPTEQIQENRQFPATAYENVLIKCLDRLVGIYKTLGVNTPIAILLTFIGIKNYQLPGNFLSDGGHKFDRPVLSLPEVVMENFDTKSEVVLKPVFDIMWNAFGYIGSPNYSNEGDRIKR